MAKPKKTRQELEEMIVAEVRRHPHCEHFKSISLYRIVDPAAAGKFSWSRGVCDYGEAGMESCDAALAIVIPRLQALYDMTDE